MLELWFDFSCPYAYLASRRAVQLGLAVDPTAPPSGGAADRSQGPVIDWRPMLLGGVFRGIGAGDGPMATLSPQKAAHNFHDMYRWADVFGVPFQLPAAHPMRSVLALRTLLALPHDRWPAAITAIYAAYWQRADDITRADVLADALRGAGIPDDEIAAAAARTEDPAIKDELRRRTDEAIELGVFGAPAWVLRRDGAHHLIWGQDRMMWVEAMAAGWTLDGPPPGGAQPLTLPPVAAGKTVDVYFDVASPFAYFALTQLPAFTAAGVTPRLVPILLGALFRDIGQSNVPLFSMPAAKQRYVGAEMMRWSWWWGVPFNFPRKFPQRTITAQRLCILAAADGFEIGAKVALALGRAMWADQRDLEDEASVRAVLGELGLADGTAERWLAQTQAPEIKAQLASNTAAARDLGVFGVPTFIVDGKHVFWGQDRLELVGKALAGWNPPEPLAPRAAPTGDDA